MTPSTSALQGTDPRKPRLCVIGPMVGRTPGHVTHPGELLSDLFAREGYPVISASAALNRAARFADICSTLVRHGREVDIMVLQVYAAKSFVVEDSASWLSKAFGHRIIMFLHGGTLPEFIQRFPGWTRRVLHRAALVVAPSEYLARVVQSHGIDADIIPNVIDLSAYPHRERPTLRPRLFWMRSFHDHYNPEMAVRVLASLRDVFPEATLVMAGQDRGAEPGVKGLAHRLGLSDHVRFVGFLDADGKAREAEKADIYLNTTRLDNMPVTVLEAFALGMPVVATHVGGIGDMLTDGQDALLVPSDDHVAMAAAVRRLLEDADLAARLMANGWRIAKDVSWDAVRPRWEAAFNKVLT